MKSTISRVVSVLGIVAATGIFSPNATALSWTLSPDANALAFGVTVVNGVNQINFANAASQPAGIFGAGFTWIGTDFSMNFDADLYSWDSYNALTGIGTGWWDAFVVTVSTVDFYWNLFPSDPVSPSASTWVWGGTNYADGILESYITAPATTDNISLAAGLATYYVSLVLDTKSTPHTDTSNPSWGSFHVAPIPEPETYAMLLAGLGLLGFSARRRNSRV